MVQADYLFLMTDVDCLYTKNPRTHPDAEAIEVVEDVSSIVADVSSSGSSLGTGGMSTKLVAARLATSAGVTTVITRSSKPGNVIDIVRHVQTLKSVASEPPSRPATPLGDDCRPSPMSSLNSEPCHNIPLHTRFLPDPHPIRDRRFWLLHGLAPHGAIYIDEGAQHALLNKAGLLPVGIIDVEGNFAQQEAVRIVVGRSHLPVPPNPSNLSTQSAHDHIGVEELAGNLEVGRALVNYSATEIRRIKGLRSSEIQGMLGYADSEYVALRENISMLKKETVKAAS